MERKKNVERWIKRIKMKIAQHCGQQVFEEQLNNPKNFFSFAAAVRFYFIFFFTSSAVLFNLFLHNFLQFLWCLGGCLGNFDHKRKRQRQLKLVTCRQHTKLLLSSFWSAPFLLSAHTHTHTHTSSILSSPICIFGWRCSLFLRNFSQSSSVPMNRCGPTNAHMLSYYLPTKPREREREGKKEC